MPSKPRKRKCRYCAGLKEDCQTLRQYGANLRAEIERLRAENADLSGRLDGADRCHEELTSEISELTNERQKYWALYGAAQRERDEARRELVEYRNAQNRECAELVESLERCSATVRSITTELARKPWWRRWFGGSMITAVANRLRGWREG